VLKGRSGMHNFNALSRMSTELALPSESNMMYDSAISSSQSVDFPSNNPIKKTIRSNFPETWLFQIDISK
jgi:hypothetical protein